MLVTTDRRHRYSVQFPEPPWCARCTGWSLVSVVGTGCRCSRVVGQFRSAGIARPARRPRPAPVAGSRKRAAAGGYRRPGTPGPARPAAGGPPTAFRPRAGQHRGGGQVPGPPNPGELVDVSGDPADDRRHPHEVGGHDGPARPAGGRAQADRRRAAISIQVREPACALPQPAHSSDSRLAMLSRPSSSVSSPESEPSGAGQPAAPQLAERRVQRTARIIDRVADLRCRPAGLTR